MGPFRIKSCYLSTIAIGESASTILELRDLLLIIPKASLYFHFWGERLRPTFTPYGYHNDFARWAHFSLHDDVLSEKLAAIDPADYPIEKNLRKKLIAIIDEHLDGVDSIGLVSESERFHFLRSVVLSFDTDLFIEDPKTLKTIVKDLSLNSIFYHLIDAKKRNGIDDFSVWLEKCGPDYQPQIQKIRSINPYFLSLEQIRDKLVEIFHG
jgi:hypothetical protein